MPYVPYRTVRDKTSQKLRGSIYELPRSNVFNRRLLAAAEDGLIAYGSFSSSVTQPVTAGTPLALTYDTKDLTTTPYVNAVLSPASSQITVSLNGIYTVLTSIQVDQTTTLNDVEFYVSINGTAVANSASRMAITPAVEDIFTVEWMLELVAGDSVEVYMSTLHAGFRALAIAASAPVPLIPSVITNIKRIANYTLPPLIITTTGTPLVTISGGRTYYTFNNSGSFQNNIPVSVDYLALGGGGGGGRWVAGGGGAGGAVQATSFTLTPDTRTITIGGGGAGGTGTPNNTGINGQNTVFGTIATALGGGGGGGFSGVGVSGLDGGCGGGGSFLGGKGNGGTQGFDGGSMLSGVGGAGGGGVGGVGGSGTGTGTGGLGLTYNSIQLGGGGGGGADGSAAGVGTFGGGNGGISGVSSGGDGFPGATNRGGGGGGSGNGFSAPNGNGGNGGSGIFIISYLG